MKVNHIRVSLTSILSCCLYVFTRNVSRASFGVEPISLCLLFSLIIVSLSYVWINFEIKKLNELILKK